MPDVSDWYSVAPDCVKDTGDLGSGFENLAAPYEDCTGFFDFGQGTVYAGAPGQPVPEGAMTGDVIQDASTALWLITAVGFAVMVLAFVAWVWFENKKLWAQASLLRGASSAPAPGERGSAEPGTRLDE